MPQANAILVPSAPLLGTANSILMARARRHSVRDFPGPLSIKAVLDGRVAWRTDGRDILVDSSSFLVLNDGEPYSMEIDAQQPVTTCCVFFAHGFVESVWRDLGRSEEHLLDEPDGLGEPLTFISRLHPRDGRVVPSMRALRDRALAGNCASGLEEGFLLLARDLLLVYEEMRKQLTRVPSARASTRAEMLRRISRGRDFLHAHAYDALTLGQVAHAACLSPYHFHRIFTRTFGETPHSYLTRLRLDRAHQLLLSEVPVTEVCNAVGFESLGSFSVLFRKHFGVPPSRFRYPLKA